MAARAGHRVVSFTIDRSVSVKCRLGRFTTGYLTLYWNLEHTPCYKRYDWIGPARYRPLLDHFVLRPVRYEDHLMLALIL